MSWKGDHLLGWIALEGCANVLDYSATCACELGRMPLAKEYAKKARLLGQRLMDAGMASSDFREEMEDLDHFLGRIRR